MIVLKPTFVVGVVLKSESYCGLDNLATAGFVSQFFEWWLMNRNSSATRTTK